MKEVNRIIKKRGGEAWRITCDLLNTGLQSAGLSGHLSVLHCWHRWGQWDARTLTLTLFTSCTMPWGPMTNGQSDPGERHLKTWRRAPWMVRRCRLFPLLFWILWNCNCQIFIFVSSLWNMRLCCTNFVNTLVSVATALTFTGRGLASDQREKLLIEQNLTFAGGSGIKRRKVADEIHISENKIEHDSGKSTRLMRNEFICLMSEQVKNKKVKYGDDPAACCLLSDRKLLIIHWPLIKFYCSPSNLCNSGPTHANKVLHITIICGVLKGSSEPVRGAV